jgi:hypothetical protein
MENLTLFLLIFVLMICHLCISSLDDDNYVSGGTNTFFGWNRSTAIDSGFRLLFVLLVLRNWCTVVSRERIKGIRGKEGIELRE